MRKGILCALGACFFWGLVYVIPGFIKGFSSVEIVLARYFFYGAVSCLVIFRKKFHFPLSIWREALKFSLISSIFYYTGIVFCLKYASPSICALILGLSPILVAFLGNAREKLFSFKMLFLPSLLILLGLLLINVPHIMKAESLPLFTLGVGAGLFALASWTWYIYSNARFLQRHPSLDPADWSTLMGIAGLVWVFLIFPFVGIDFRHYGVFDYSFATFLVGSLTLGLFSSWVARLLWNKASSALPVSITGQLTIFETVFGLILVYITSKTFPPFLEVVGICCLLGSLFYVLHAFSRAMSLAENQ